VQRINLTLFEVKMHTAFRCLVVLLFTYEAASLHAQNQPGDIVWKKSFVEDPSSPKRNFIGYHSTASLDNNGNLLVLPHSGNPTCITRDGNVKWVHTLEAKSWQYGSPAYSSDFDAFYFGVESPNKFIALNASDGTKLWEVETKRVVRTTPAISDKYIVYGDYNTKYFCHDIKTGEKKWAFDAKVEGRRPDIYSSPVIGLDNTVYGAPHNHNLYALDIETGKLKWKFEANYKNKEESVESSPALNKEGNIVIGLDKVYLINRIDGSIIWSFDSGNSRPKFGTPAIGEKKIYIGSTMFDPEKGYKVFCLDMLNGKKIWEFYTGLGQWPGCGIAIGQENEIYFQAATSLFCVDGNSGKLIWNIDENFSGRSSPILTEDGYIYIGTETYGSNKIGIKDGFIACVKANSGLAETAWPLFRQNIHGTGEMDTSLKVVDHPESQVVVEGSALQLQVEALGLGELKYQWKFNGENLNGETFDKLSLFGVTADMAGEYTISISDDNSTVESEPAVVQVLFPPKVTMQPESQEALAGTTVRFSVEATGTPPLNYQWKFSGLPLGGSDGPDLELNNVKESFSGEFTVTITNEHGEVTSEPAMLTVIKDSDLDGLSDIEEQAINSDPNNADTDSDGLKDGEEVSVHKTDPTIADTDQDGLLDGLEIRGGFDPTVASERQPGNVEIRVAVELEFFTMEWEKYQLQSSLDLTNWENEGETFNGVGGYSSIYQSARDSKVFWRLKLIN
jgi:outer membrane protein assembly factor BamB